VQVKGKDRTTLFLEALIVNCPIAIVVLDSQHKVQICNPAFERLFLYSQEELKRANLDKLITDKETRSQAVALTKRVLAGQTVHATTIRRRKDGIKVEVEIQGIPLMMKDSLVGVYGLYQDVTESKRTERLLRELSARLLRSQDEERRRVARELHDSTAQSLSALGVNLTRLKGLAGDLSTRKLLSDSVALAEQCAREIRTLMYLRPFFSSRIARMMLDGYLKAPADFAATSPYQGYLSSRERQVVELLAEGKRNKEVAVSLGISLRTAETHRRNIMRKLGVHSAAQLVRYAILNKILKP